MSIEGGAAGRCSAAKNESRSCRHGDPDREREDAGAIAKMGKVSWAKNSTFDLSLHNCKELDFIPTPVKGLRIFVPDLGGETETKGLNYSYNGLRLFHHHCFYPSCSSWSAARLY